MNYSITINGFKSKDDLISWLKQYEGGIEQYFEDCTSNVNHNHYYSNSKGIYSHFDKFRNNNETNFNLELQTYNDEE